MKFCLGWQANKVVDNGQDNSGGQAVRAGLGLGFRGAFAYFNAEATEEMRAEAAEVALQRLDD